MYYKKQELLTIHKHMDSSHVSLFLGGIRVAHLFNFQCCVFIVWLRPLSELYPMFAVSLECPFLIALRISLMFN